MYIKKSTKKSEETDNFGVIKNCFGPKQANGHETHFVYQLFKFS